VLEKESGPFVEEYFALEETAVACTAYLRSSLDFIDPIIPHARRVQRVAQGLHGLHPYATVNWLTHIQRLIDNREHGEGQIPDALVNAFKELAARHTELLSLTPSAELHRAGGKEETDVFAFAPFDTWEDIARGIQNQSRCVLAASTNMSKSK
jgi:hypothetical protein